jgi:D-alanyl-D-alanine carboxypeptidase (penicillin-binding protein 5/6)
MSGPPATSGPASRRARRLALATAAAVAVTALGSPAVAATTPTLPPPPVCANAISTASGTVTSAPTPLPVPTSTVGGPRLSSPGLQLDLATEAPRPPALRATAWLVADLDTGTVVASCNAHVRLAPASTLKILTSLALAHRLNWSTRYVGRQTDAATDGTRVGIVPGSSYTVRDLFHGLMLASGNDAATALATLSGGMPTTAALMNAEARRLGGFDTTAVNDSGLDAPGQATSVYDLALFGRAALADPLIAQLIATKTYTFPGKGDRPPRPSFQIQNHNALLFNYPGASGVKNGYTVAAGGSYVGSAARNGHRYLVSVLQAEGATWHLARQLLDWAFAAASRTAPVGRLVAPGEVPGPDATAEVSPSPTPASGTSTPGGRVTAQAAGTRAAATGTPEDTRTGWIVLATLGVLLVGGLSLAGERGRRTVSARGTRRPGAGRTAGGKTSSGGRKPRARR